MISPSRTICTWSGGDASLHFQVRLTKPRRKARGGPLFVNYAKREADGKRAPKVGNLWNRKRELIDSSRLIPSSRNFSVRDISVVWGFFFSFFFFFGSLAETRLSGLRRRKQSPVSRVGYTSGAPFAFPRASPSTPAHRGCRSHHEQAACKMSEEAGMEAGGRERKRERGAGRGRGGGKLCH